MDGIKEIGKETNDKGARGRDFLSSSPAFHRDKSLSLSLSLSLSVLVSSSSSSTSTSPFEEEKTMGLGPAGFGERFLVSFLVSFCLTCFARFFLSD